jgi:glutamine kinase
VKKRPPFSFGTKAEALERLRPLLRGAEVLDLFHFRVGDWRRSPAKVLQAIRARFQRMPVAVRSSAVSEDTQHDSRAGAFRSCLHVDAADPAALGQAIEHVAASLSGNPLDQVLVQPMLGDVTMSGVLMTRDLEDGAPYHVINYDDESGKTDTVTGGTGVNKTVYIFHRADPAHVQSPRIHRILDLARELEAICGPVPLDVEFALTESGRLVVFQVRRISVSRNWRASVTEHVAASLPPIESFIAERSAPRSALAGRRTILGVMPDWNPAEMIGTTPSRLAASLYRELITRQTWREARVRLGYRDVPAEELMVLLAGRPYIDVRNSFNSFLPAALPDETANALVDAWLDRLEVHPEWHDKVEFEVAHTCRDFAFEESFRNRYDGILPRHAFADFKSQLTKLTARLLDGGKRGSLHTAEQAIATLAARQEPLRTRVEDAGPDVLARVSALLEDCRLLGTLPFAMLARHAFVAEALLRSVVVRGALREESLAAFRRSLNTVTSSFSQDLADVCAGRGKRQRFLECYGHLRPGTYDIRSLRYADRDDLFDGCLPPRDAKGEVRFRLRAAERRALQQLLAESGLGRVTVDGLFRHARRAITGRESAKFVFTRNLSDALEMLADWGESLGLSREQLAHLRLEDILETLTRPALVQARRHFLELAEQGHLALQTARAVKLGFLIRHAGDVHVVPMHRSAPNFIGRTRLQERIVRLDSISSAHTEMFQKVVCIENADPGFDFIFTRGIRGLVTKYGGANSHMAIRCAELDLPAAIGCGEQVFERIVAAGAVDLDCAARLVRPLHEH